MTNDDVAVTVNDDGACEENVATKTSIPKPSHRDVRECEFPSWYRRFRRSRENAGLERNLTPRSVTIPIPSAFCDWLRSDGVTLPPEATALSSFVDAAVGDDDDDDSDVDWSNDDDDNDDDPAAPSFPELTSSVEAAIQKLGGSVFPKLNWSSPKDASWANGGTLRCSTPGDVYLLLKSSDFVAHDLDHARDGLSSSSPDDDDDDDNKESSFVLVLRKWCNLHPCMEFRCFVQAGRFVAASQRDHTQFYPFLSVERPRLRRLLTEFWTDHVRRRFPLDDYVWDCYVASNEVVHLFDFNVWGERTDPLLFEWSELVSGVAATKTTTTNEDDDDEPEMRVVESDDGVRFDPLASYRAPIDAVDLANGDSASFAEFMSMCGT